jgi:hypothetical protein
MNSKLFGVVFSVAVSGSAQAAVADKSTDAMVNFLQVSGAVLTTINSLDNRDQLFSGSYLAMASVKDHGGFQRTGSDSSSSSGTSPSTLTGLNQLSLAAHASDASHQGESDAASCSAGSDSCSLSWNGLLAELAGDIVHVEFPGGTVSIPSSMLLFGPGLLGLTIVARRRNSLPN